MAPPPLPEEAALRLANMPLYCDGQTKILSVYCGNGASGTPVNAIYVGTEPGQGDGGGNTFAVFDNNDPNDTGPDGPQVGTQQYSWQTADGLSGWGARHSGSTGQIVISGGWLVNECSRSGWYASCGRLLGYPISNGETVYIEAEYRIDGEFQGTPDGNPPNNLCGLNNHPGGIALALGTVVPSSGNIGTWVYGHHYDIETSGLNHAPKHQDINVSFFFTNSTGFPVTTFGMFSSCQSVDGISDGGVPQTQMKIRRFQLWDTV